jgi:hypothetical protein
LTPRTLPPTAPSDQGKPAEVQVNPFVTRPTVELAERPSASSDGVIHQPDKASNPMTR